MSVHDPSLQEPGTVTSEPNLPQYPSPEINGSVNADILQKIEVGPDGRLTKAQEPTLTAPPEDIVYPEERMGIIPEVGIPPVRPVVLRRTVSGAYSGISGSFRLDLRVDIDRPNALNMASFDFYSLGSVTSYFGSFQVPAPAISYTNTHAIIDGAITGTTAVWANRVQIEINRNFILVPAAPAIVTFFRNSARGAAYTCRFTNPYFRTVRLEEDYENGTTLLGSYNTGELPSPLPHRTLTVTSGYAEAGIQMTLTSGTDSISNAEAGADARWTETEMHSSMIHHFSIYSNLPQWAAWLFAARRAVDDRLLGIMFDYLPGLRPGRQGCAIFQDSIRSYHPTDADYRRHLLYTYVHELGHAFNLLHSWDKGRPDSLSWMNYDWKYDQRNGLDTFWNNFAFNFDTGELRHIRHGFRNNVIMGGSDWAVGAGLTEGSGSSIFEREMIENNSGLKLEMVPVKTAFALGEPVVVELKLRCMDLNGKTINANLHPKTDHVRVGILKPNGKTCVYEPVAHLCMAEKEVNLTADSNTAYASAYIGYGKDGFYFDQPGFYRLKAAYLNKDGSVIQSDEALIRVKSPVTQAEDEIADMYFTGNAGMLFYMMGSDSPSLKKGMDDFQKVSDKYKTNGLSVYADLVLGINEAMKFKVVDPETKRVSARKRNLTGAEAKLSKVFTVSKASGGIDNITLNWSYRQLAKGYLLEGDEKSAKATLKEMEDSFKAKKLKPAVMHIIAGQAAETLRVNKKVH
jgi:hypothetical protein